MSESRTTWDELFGEIHNLKNQISDLTSLVKDLQSSQLNAISSALRCHRKGLESSNGHSDMSDMSKSQETGKTLAPAPEWMKDI